MDSHTRIPFWIKIAYTAFVVVLVPVYWRAYRPANFLYFCDVALFLGLIAVWRESSLWASIALVGILLPQTLWIVDFLAAAAGWRIAGITEYMFNAEIPFFTRALSFFHFWLPLFLLWLVARLGYDRRALPWSVAAGWTLLIVCYTFVPPPPAPVENPNQPVNVNYVYGFGDKAPQTIMPPLAYLALLMLLVPTALYLPAHFLLAKLFARRSSPSTL